MTTTAIKTAASIIKCQPGPTRRLLLVDDDENMRSLLADMVRDWSFSTTTAGTFREARDVVATATPFSVIVSDYHLPDGNGLEFFDWLKREMALQVPFLLISGGMARLPAAGQSFEFLAKPFRRQDFRTQLERLSAAQLPAVPALQTFSV